MRKHARWSLMCGFVVLLWSCIWFGNDLLIGLESARPSLSFGTPASGRLEHGKRLPSSGPNFEAYSRIGTLLGRNSVHSVVRQIVLEAYAKLAVEQPQLAFVYGETGWPSGGPFAPHRTHQNGLSVDFMVPLLDAQNRTVRLPTWPWQRFGYDLEFDAKGRLGELLIDFQALGLHLQALQKAARAHGSDIKLLILEPELQTLLWQSAAGAALRGRFPVMNRSAWVRHDEHYHVDFVQPDK